MAVRGRDSGDEFSRQSPAGENARDTSRPAEQEGGHGSELLGEFPAQIAAQINADKDAELHSMTK